jgi:hypothetical protein
MIIIIKNVVLLLQFFKVAKGSIVIDKQEAPGRSDATAAGGLVECARVGLSCRKLDIGGVVTHRRASLTLFGNSRPAGPCAIVCG